MTSDDRLLVSVAVSTHGRAGSVPRLVAALERQTLAKESFEVVIADDGSRDETPAVLAHLASESPLEFRVVRLERSRGAAAGRNAALKSARGAVIAFTDDDCQPSPTWLQRGLEALSDADAVAGRTHPHPDQLDRLGPYSRTMWPSYADTFPTCNVFYRRDDLEAVGGFDEGFNRRGGEDTDLACRVRGLGRRLCIADDVVVYHDVHAGTFRTAVRESIRWSTIPLLVRKHPELRRSLLSFGVFWKQHQWLLLAAAGLAVAPLIGSSVLLAAPWVLGHMRRRHEIPKASLRVRSLPGAFVADLALVGVLAMGSIRHRTLVL